MKFSAVGAPCALVALLAFSGAACGDDDPATGGKANITTPDGGAAGDAQPTPGCGTANPKTGLVGAQTVSVNGTSRTYQLYVPDAYDAKTAYPIVFSFHGDGGDGKSLRSGLTLEKESAGGAIFVYPDGLNKTWAIDAPANDIAFVDAMVQELGKTYCTDATRLFALGFSRGAYFANQLVCRSTSGFRGVSSNSGGGPFGIGASEFDGKGNLKCPRPPIASLVIQGSSDNNVPPSEAQKTLDYFVPANGCTTTTSATTPSPCVTYDGCAAGRPVEYCLVQGMGHQIWTNTSSVAWAFFKAL